MRPPNRPRAAGPRSLNPHADRIGARLRISSHLSRRHPAKNILFDNRARPMPPICGVALGCCARCRPPGWLAYWPRTRWRNNDATAAVDHTRLALIVYQLIAGRLPFRAHHRTAVDSRAPERTPACAGLDTPELPKRYRWCLSARLRKTLRQRFRSSSNFAQAFKSAIEGAAVSRPAFSLSSCPSGNASRSPLRPDRHRRKRPPLQPNRRSNRLPRLRRRADRPTNDRHPRVTVQPDLHPTAARPVAFLARTAGIAVVKGASEAGPARDARSEHER